MQLTDKRFLVCGGAGFIGSHVVEALLAKPVAEVMVYDSFARGTLQNLETARRDPRVTIVEGAPDICDYDRLSKAMDGIDGVFNLVAIGIIASNASPNRSFEVNVHGNWNVIRAAVENGVRKIVHSSSASVYGEAQRIPMSEDHPYNNRTFYGATKIAMEHLLQAQALMSSLEWAALRYFNVYGSRQHYKGAYTSVFHKILDRLYDGKPPVLHGDGTQMLDLVYVSDVARANVMAMEAESSNGRFNVCSGVGTELREIAGLLMDLTGIQFDPEYREDPTRPNNLVAKRIGDPSRAREELGFETEINAVEGVRRLVQWRAAQT